MLVNEVPEFKKEFKIITITSSENVSEAVELLTQYNIGALPIVDDNDIVSGVISERDVIKKVLGKNLKPEETLIADVMTPNPNTVSPGDDVFDCILSTIEGGYRHLIITDNEKKLISVLSHRDLATVLWSELGNKYMDNKYTLGDFVELKANEGVITLTPEHTVADTINLMTDHNFGAVPITDHKKLVGIFTERDALNRVIQKKLDYETLPVNKVMTRKPDVMTYDTPIKSIADSMVFKKYRHLLIRTNDSSGVKDILSVRDFVDIAYNILFKN